MFNINNLKILIFIIIYIIIFDFKLLIIKININIINNYEVAAGFAGACGFHPRNLPV
jgi:hypothetical protein